LFVQYAGMQHIDFKFVGGVLIYIAYCEGPKFVVVD